MFIREDGEIESGLREKDMMPHLEEDNEVEYPMDGKILVTRHDLNVQIKEDEEQQENIFYTRCHVNDKMCSMIINRESCINIDKLSLSTLKHLRPYKL